MVELNFVRADILSLDGQPLSRGEAHFYNSCSGHYRALDRKPLDIVLSPGELLLEAEGSRRVIAGISRCHSEFSVHYHFELKDYLAEGEPLIKIPVVRGTQPDVPGANEAAEG